MRRAACRAGDLSMTTLRQVGVSPVRSSPWGKEKRSLAVREPGSSQQDSRLGGCYQAARCRAGGIRTHTENSLQRTLSHQQDPNPLTTTCTMFLSKIPISARSLPIAGLRFCQVRTTLEIELAMDYVRSSIVRSFRWPTTRTGSTHPASIATQKNTYKGPAWQAPGLPSS
jgi:hypothetical protein